MKKNIVTIFIALMMLLSVSACSGNSSGTVKNQLTKDTNEVKDSIEDVTDDIKNRSEDIVEDIDGEKNNDSVKNNDSSLIPYQFDYNGLYRQYSNNNSGYYESSETYKYKQEGDSVYDDIKSISGIEDVKIAIIDKRAYCALKTNTGSFNISDEKKAEIGNMIKLKYPQVKNVYFSQKTQGFNSLKNAIDKGLDNITDDLLNLFESK